MFSPMPEYRHHGGIVSIKSRVSVALASRENVLCSGRNGLLEALLTCFIFRELGMVPKSQRPVTYISENKEPPKMSENFKFRELRNFEKHWTRLLYSTKKARQRRDEHPQDAWSINERNRCLDWKDHCKDLDERGPDCFRRQYRMPQQIFEKLADILRSLLEVNQYFARSLAG